MKLSKLMKVLGDGTACFSIKGLCEEYTLGVDELKKETWYLSNKDRKVKRIVAIGGGCYKTEVRIELEEGEP